MLCWMPAGMLLRALSDLCTTQCSQGVPRKARFVSRTCLPGLRPASSPGPQAQPFFSVPTRARATRPSHEIVKTVLSQAHRFGGRMRRSCCRRRFCRACPCPRPLQVGLPCSHRARRCSRPPLPPVGGCIFAVLERSGWWHAARLPRWRSHCTLSERFPLGVGARLPPSGVAVVPTRCRSVLLAPEVGDCYTTSVMDCPELHWLGGHFAAARAALPPLVVIQSTPVALVLLERGVLSRIGFAAHNIEAWRSIP